METRSERTHLEAIPDLFRRAIAKHEYDLRSAARGGAKTVLGLMMAHHPEVDIWHVTRCMPETYEDGSVINPGQVLESVSGYATRVARMVDTKVYYKEYEVPRGPNRESSDVGDDDREENGEAEASEAMNEGDEPGHPRDEA